MEKVIEKLEKRVTLIADNLEFTLKELEERVTDKEKTLAEIEGHRTYIKQLKEALATTEKNGGATHEYLLQELECVRRNRERIEGVGLPNIEEDIETLREDVKNLRGKLEDAEYTLARLKGEVPKTIPLKVRKETACCGSWVKPLEVDGTLGNQLIPITSIKIDAEVIGDTFSVVAEGVGKSFTEYLKDNISALK